MMISSGWGYSEHTHDIYPSELIHRTPFGGSDPPPETIVRQITRGLNGRVWYCMSKDILTKWIKIRMTVSLPLPIGNEV